MASVVPSESLLIRPDILRRFDFPSLFGNDRPVELELGSGDGSFLLQYAGRRPGVNFLAVERLLGRLRKIERKAPRLGLRNIRGLRLEATYLLEWMIPPGSLSAIHVYFPDPWPKKRHLRRRLVNDAFAVLAARAYAPGGSLICRTDDADYFEQMTTVLDAAAGFVRGVEPADLLEVNTDFETQFNAEGKPTRHAVWVRSEGAASR
jgi:tRNA (guanine-N7-)-methyltransferase